jgi:hypothetical protein
VSAPTAERSAGLRNAAGDSKISTKLGRSWYLGIATSSNEQPLKFAPKANEAEGRPESDRLRLPSRFEASREAERRYQTLQPIRLGEIKRFRDAGVSVDALCEPELPARAEVVFHDDESPTFDFAAYTGEEGSVSAFIFLARDEEGEPSDLVAWAPNAKRLAAWYGSAVLLGTETVNGPHLDPEGALPVFETPLSWLLADRNGVVIIHSRRAAPILRAAEPLRVSSAAFRTRLRQIVAPRRPRIFLPEARTIRQHRALAL